MHAESVRATRDRNRQRLLAGLPLTEHRIRLAGIPTRSASPAVLVGHLLGGAIAARYAIAHPERVRGLVLVDSMGLAPFRPSVRFALAMAGFMARPNERSQERLFRGCFVDVDGGAQRHGRSVAAARRLRARDQYEEAAP